MSASRTPPKRHTPSAPPNESRPAGRPGAGGKDAAGGLREALLAAEAASQAKSEFLANMGHDLTSPLNAVIGFSEVLLDRYFGELNAKQVEYVSIIRESGHRLLSLLTDILQLAKLDAGDAALALAPASPAGLVRACLEMNREKALRHNITLDLDLAPDLEQATLLDEVKFRQVLFALLGNAVKSTPDNGQVRISGRRMGKDGGEVLEMGVADSGPGVPPEIASGLFTPYARPESPQAAGPEGTGLGLALARRLARLQGGDVALAESSAQGRRLVFTLPVRDSVSGPADAGQRPAETSGA